MTTRVAARPALLALALLLLLTAVAAPVMGSRPSATAAAASLVTVGADLTGPAPTHTCGAQTCSLVNTEGAGNTLAAVSGAVRTLRVRHGKVPGGLITTDLRLLVLDREGDGFTLVRSAKATLAASDASDKVSVFSTNLAVAAGQYLGLEVTSAWAGDELAVIGTVGSGDVLAMSGSHASGTRTYAAESGYRVPFNVDIETGAGDPGTGDPGTGDPGTGDPGTPGDDCAPMPFEPRRVAGSPSKVGGKGNWPGQVVGRHDNFNDVRLRYDGKGRAHAAGRGVFHDGVYYYGHGGAWQLDASLSDGSVGLDLDAKGRPMVAWGATKPSAGRTIQYCPRLYLARVGGPVELLRQLPAGGSGFQYVDLARDRRTGHSHLVSEVGGRLVHHPVGGRPQPLDVRGVRETRVAAAAGTVVVAARTRTGFRVLVRAGGGGFKTLVKTGTVTDFDVDVSPTGKVAVAWSAGAVPKLFVHNGSRAVRSDIKAESVGVSRVGDRLDVVFSLRGRPTCTRFGCAGNGIFHLGLRGTRGRISTVQGSVGFSPSRLSVDTVGRRVGVGYGNPANNGYLTVRSRTF
jgi:hypothetical protein